ncbi:MAG: bifunctional riboflavin kinase/FAD synthetase [Actinomycetota bacterium]|nr:bifunctional riboflavin kinase/FAD synthetase [Actinomycetota bacterium]
MITAVGLNALSTPEGSVVTIGTFDGVHVGHRTLIARTKDEAATRGLPSAVVTWDRHPNATLRPDAVPLLLSTPERKVELIEELGVDILLVLPFDRELSHWPPERFVRDVLVNGLAARAVLVGQGWRFGHRAAGDVALLSELGVNLGFDAEGVPLVTVAGGPASSSRVRDRISAGDMELTRTLLGRPFALEGRVVAGDDRGASLGYPTANVTLDPTIATPPRGIYAGRAKVEGLAYPAAISLGVKPTFGGDPELSPLVLEAFLLDFEGDLYGADLRIEFLERLRDELKFDNVDELVAQMDRDVTATRRLHDRPEAV